jgi:subtilase family serine protease
MRINRLLNASLLLASALSVQYVLASPMVEQSKATALVQAASPAEMVDFKIYLPLRNQKELGELLEQLHDKNSSKYQQWLQPAEFLTRFGPTESDLARVRSSLTSHGFTIVDSNAHGVHVKGPVSAVAATFGSPVHKQITNGRTHYFSKNALQLPSELAEINMRVVGLSAIPERHVHSRVLGLAPAAVVDNRYGATGSYWFDDLKQAYDYPAYSAKTDGTGVNVAILMSDLIFPGDVAAAFTHEMFTTITGKPAPTVTTVLIDGGGVENGNGSFEASLDVQQVLGGAPGANVTLVSIPDLSDQSIIDGYTYIVDSNSYDIVNSSFGGCELEYTAADNGGTDFTYILQQEHEIYAQGNAQGITFVASSGDNSGVMCPSANYAPGVDAVFQAGVSSPAGDPSVTAVGGGNLITTVTTGSLSSAYVRESAYADPEYPYDIYGIGALVSGGNWGAGGGVSSVFSKPLYQILTNTGSRNWRAVPDVGMMVGGEGFSDLNGQDGPGFCNDTAISCSPDDSSVLTAFGVGIGGGFYFTIGTSVSSPEFVGALALYEQKFGKHHRMGNVNYFLYAAGLVQTLFGGANAPESLQFFHRKNPGFNGVVHDSYPSYNYNYVYGNGSPDVRKLFGFTDKPAAGVPQTPSNP